MPTLIALYDRSVRQRPEALAVKDASHAWSYRGLDARANALAHELRRRGVRRGDAVVVYCERSAHAVLAVVAIMKAGGVFVPVSLDTPPARLDFIGTDAEPKLLLVDEKGRERLAGCVRPVPAIVIDDIAFSQETVDGLSLAVMPNDPAYIIYTSGTTGHPKGILIEHGSIARRFEDWDVAYGLTGAPLRILQVAKLGFDVFTADVVKALCSGGTLVICPAEAVLDPARFFKLLVDEAIDYVDIVPAVLRNLMEYLEATGEDLASVRMLNCGADVWNKDEYQRARRITRVERLFNSYGVTECTVENTLFEDDGSILANKSTLPIGRPLASDTILIVDDDLTPVPPGISGQLCIGGPCVARGYVKRPELNESAFFVRDGVRFYKTGDLARIDADGLIEFLGRIDFQVKINGYRIELEEIERVVERFPGVRQAVVCLDAARALIAFVRTVDGAPLNAAECTAQLARQLPSYMVPARIVVVESFPLNQNGKVDRVLLAKELVPPEPSARKAHDLHESRSVAELREKLARRGIDVISLVNEFIKPSAKFGLMIAGALAEGQGSEVSPLELLVLLEDDRAMKRRKEDVAGCVVEYHPLPNSGNTRAALVVDGLEIGLHFVVDGHAAVVGGLSDYDWTLHGDDVVARWRQS